MLLKDTNIILVGMINLGYGGLTWLDRDLAGLYLDTTTPNNWLEGLDRYGGLKMPILRPIVVDGVRHPIRIVYLGKFMPSVTKNIAENVHIALLASSSQQDFFSEDELDKFYTRVSLISHDAVNIFRNNDVPIVFAWENSESSMDTAELRELLSLNEQDELVLFQRDEPQKIMDALIARIKTLPKNE